MSAVLPHPESTTQRLDWLAAVAGFGPGNDVPDGSNDEGTSSFINTNSWQSARLGWLALADAALGVAFASAMLGVVLAATPGLRCRLL
jgi:hypothetical protein